MAMIMVVPSAGCFVGPVHLRGAHQGEGNRTRHLELAGASRAGLGSRAWKTQPRLSVSAGTMRHMCKNK